MAKQGTSMTVPRLRFPEFREAAAWKERKLEELIDTISPPAKLQSSSYLVTGKFPIIDQSQDAICGWTDDAQVVVEGPLPLIVFGDHTCTLKFVERPFAQGADGIKILTSKPAVSIEYLFHSLNHRPLVMEDYKRHFSTLKERRVFFPSVESGEQQKIANCLTSLDEVIAAQGRKVKALKAHKRGLMQQLFPREGETRPRLRFPEFRDAPEWGERELGDFANISKGKGISKAEIAVSGVTPCIRYGELYTIYGEIIDRVQSRTNVQPSELVLSEAGDVIIPASGETKEDIATCAVVLDSGVALGGDLNVVRADMDGRFFSYYLNGSKRRALARVAQGDAVVHLYPRQLEKLKVNIPASKAEQKRIADLLSSLDAQIAAESNQLAALKTHKQGLMQQLFPVPEAASA